MTRYFVDSSALLKRYVLERGTPRLLEIFESDDKIVVSRLAHAEVTSAVVRRARAGDIEGDELAQLLVVFESELRTRFDVVELRSAVITRSVDLIRTHGLRAADAIQLSCAIIAGESEMDRQDFAVLSSDRELNEAARAEGLTIVDPEVEAADS